MTHSVKTRRAIAAPAPCRNGGALIHRLLQQYSVDCLFGHTGAVLLPLLDELGPEASPRFIVARHERAAGYMALGYARQTGKPGVVLVTSGPGATNTVAAIDAATRTATPLIVLTGQVATTALGTQAFQEADITGIVRPIATWTVLVQRPADLPTVFQRAFDLATSAAPGPVLIDLPKDVLAATDVIWPGGAPHDWRAETPPHPAGEPRPAVREMAARLRQTAPHATIVTDTTPGAALPIAIGMARGGAREVIALDTAASWLHSALEFATAAQRGIRVKAVLVEPDPQFDARHLAQAMGVAVMGDVNAFLAHAGCAVLAQPAGVTPPA